MQIGIIGNGFVGNALHEGFKDHYEVFVYDNNPLRSPNSLQDINTLETVFVCVPTPMTTTGAIDLSILKTVLGTLQNNKTIVIKSTVTPAAATEIIETYPEHQLVFNPEFLTERTAVEDFKNPSRIVLGGPRSSVQTIKELYLPLFPHVEYIQTDAKTACFIKYIANCFSAIKISAMNEFKQIAESGNIDWEQTLEGFLASGWVNPMHTQVPGPDGSLGFGGKCFPKDINAIITYAESVGVDPKVLWAAWEKNLEVRKERDWMKIPGAVTSTDKNL
tara:strand:+ start:15059 stop:15886 length:828 start_codon:yes stop_codon:yes gene_type:complete